MVSVSLGPLHLVGLVLVLFSTFILVLHINCGHGGLGVFAGKLETDNLVHTSEALELVYSGVNTHPWHLVRTQHD